MPLETQHLLIEAILGARKDEALFILKEETSKRGSEETITLILLPVLQKIGVMWDQEGGISLSQGYVAGKITNDFIGEILKEKQQNTIISGVPKGPVVIGNIEDDHHSIGRKMVTVFLQCKGWTVYDLGNDVLSEVFVQKAIEVEAKIVAVSAMMHSTAMNIKKLRQQIDNNPKLCGQVKLAVGGAIFQLHPELVEEVGGDGSAPNAFVASTVFDDLLQKSKG